MSELPIDRTAVIVASYGHEQLTLDVVEHFVQNEPAVLIIIVDNGGLLKLSPTPNLIMLKPRINLGWLIASNVGMKIAFELLGCNLAVLLNNDTTLSPHFAEGLVRACAADPTIALVGPRYDGPNTWQRPTAFPASASQWIPVDRDESVAWLEGTCIAVTRRGYHQLGDLDASTFGRFGWGADVDWCARARRDGLLVAVSDRSFVSHMGGVSAKSRYSGYYRRARYEMKRGMRSLYGSEWHVEVKYSDLRSRRALGRIRDLALEYRTLPMDKMIVWNRRAAASRLLKQYKRRAGSPNLKGSSLSDLTGHHMPPADNVNGKRNVD